MTTQKNGYDQLKDLSLFWYEVLNKYVKTDFEGIRIQCEEALSKETLQKTRLLFDLTSFKSSSHRPCENKFCLNVNDGNNCILWYSHLQEFIISETQSKISHELFIHKVLVIFWFFHSAAFERWEDSFDYTSIICCLQLSKQFLDLVNESGKLEEDDIILLKTLKKLAIYLNYDVLIENSMITNCATAFEENVQKAIRILKEITSELKSVNIYPITKEISVRFREIIDIHLEYHEKLAELAAIIVLRQSKPLEFPIRFSAEVRRNFKQFISELEINDLEHASELRAHLQCLIQHNLFASSSSLKLAEVSGGFYYCFYFDLGNPSFFWNASGLKIPTTEENTMESVLNAVKDAFNSMEEKRLIGFPFDFVISHDPAPDILDESLGEKHFKNIQIVFPRMRLKISHYNILEEEDSDKDLIIVLKPKLIHYALGIGLVTFEFSIPTCSIPEFHALKNIASPHSGLYSVHCKVYETGESAEYNMALLNHQDYDYETLNRDFHFWPRIIDVAKNIIESYRRTVVEELLHLSTSHHEIADEQKKRESAHEIFLKEKQIDFEHNWFTNFSIYKISDRRSRRLLNSEELEKHWEWTGLISYPRADRASFDDWIAQKKEALNIMNLAGIRAHSGDLFVLSENHAISYFPDDPNFIVLQYIESAKWVFLIRSLINYILAANLNIDTAYNFISMFSIEDENKLKELYQSVAVNQVNLQRSRLKTSMTLDHIAAVNVSQYSDHALLLKQAFETTRTNELVQLLKERNRDIDGLLNSFEISFQRIQDGRQRMKDRKINIFLVLLSLIQMVLVYEILTKIMLTRDTNEDLAFTYPSQTEWSWLLLLGFILVSVAFLGILYYYSSGILTSIKVSFSKVIMKFSKLIRIN